MYKKLKIKINEYIFDKKLIDDILKKRLNYLIDNTNKENKDIDSCIKLIIDDFKKLFL